MDKVREFLCGDCGECTECEPDPTDSWSEDDWREFALGLPEDDAKLANEILTGGEWDDERDCALDAR